MKCERDRFEEALPRIGLVVSVFLSIYVFAVILIAAWSGGAVQVKIYWGFLWNSIALILFTVSAIGELRKTKKSKRWLALFLFVGLLLSAYWLWFALHGRKPSTYIFTQAHHTPKKLFIYNNHEVFD